jgi:regulator of replication initiation timing
MRDMDDNALYRVRPRLLPDFLLPDRLFFRSGDGDGGDGNGGDGGSGDGNGGDGSSGAQGGGEGAGTQGGSGESTLSVEDARKVRSENRNLRQRLKDAEAERDTLKQGTQSDLEKATTQVESLSKENVALTSQNRNLRAQVAASRVGIIDPEIAASLVDWNEADTDADLEKQMNQILKARPYLAGNVAGGADGGAGTSRSSGQRSSGQEDSTDMNTMLRRAAGVIQ